VDDTRAAELRKRIGRGTRRDDGTVRKRLSRPVVVGHDDLEPQRFRLRDLFHRGDPAIDRQDESHTVLRKAAERVRRHAVALLEAARKVPDDVRAELPQE
jgi:hypothetical protein